MSTFKLTFTKKGAKALTILQSVCFRIYQLFTVSFFGSGLSVKFEGKEILFALMVFSGKFQQKSLRIKGKLKKELFGWE